MADNSFKSERRILSTRFKVKFVPPVSLNKSDTDWLSLSKERNGHHLKKRVNFHFVYIERVFCSYSLGLVTFISMGKIQDGCTMIKVCTILGYRFHLLCNVQNKISWCVSHFLEQVPRHTDRLFTETKSWRVPLSTSLKIKSGIILRSYSSHTLCSSPPVCVSFPFMGAFD